MSNLIKSGFVAFSQDDTLVIDANKNKIIQAIDDTMQEFAASEEASVEEALAEALIRDAELEGVDFGDDVLTMDTADLPNLSGVNEDLGQVAEEVVKSAKAEAEAIVNQAHDEAENMRASAYDDAEQIRQNAREEGYQTGYEEGIGQATQELQEQTEALELQRQQLENDFEQMQAKLLSDMEHNMVELLCEYISKITGVVIESQKDVLLYMVNSAMQDQDNSKKFVIKVSSEDYPLLEERKDEIYGALNPNIDMEIFEDAKLAPMQCLIETDNGIVDISLDVQLDNLKTALRLMIKD